MNNFVIALYFLLLFVNFICVWFRKKSKIILIVTYAFLLFLFINNLEYGDARSYRKDYEVMQRDSWEPGYILLRTIAKSIGIEKYQGFLAFLFCFSSIFLFVGFRALHVNLHMVYSLSMFFVCPWLFVIIRFFVGFAIAVFAMKYFYQRKYFRYALWIIISAFFHKSMVAFLLAFCIKIPYKSLIAKRDKIWKAFISLIVAVSLFVLIYTFVKKQFLFSTILIDAFAVISASVAERASIYMSRITQWGAVPVLMVYVANCWLSFLMRKEISIKKNITEVVSNNANRFTEIAWRINLIFIVFLPLDVLSVNFGRFNIIPTMFNMIALSQLGILKKRQFHKILLGFLGLVVCWGITGWINFDINIFDYVNMCGLFPE